MVIRNEKKEDRREVEELTRKAFWNVNTPGCSEHYLVHLMREHGDFVPELDLVLETGNRIAANVMYTRARLTAEDGEVKDILTFGPVSVLPEYQRRGYGRQLLEESFKKAEKLGYDCLVIFGNPENYVSRGFKSCKKYDVSLENGVFPTAMLVKELREGALDGRSWVYRESPVYEPDMTGFDEYDSTFESREKAYRPSQELFYIYSRSRTVL